MNTFRNAAAVASLLGCFWVAGGSTALPAGTEVSLRFDREVSSRTAKSGDKVELHIDRPVRVDGHTVLEAGTPVTGIIANVSKNDRFGKNARLRIALDPIRVNGRNVTLEARDKGKSFQGGQTDKAALASGGGLLLLGPLGLAGGYFVVGKAVHIKAGDHLRTEVSKTVWWR